MRETNEEIIGAVTVDKRYLEGIDLANRLYVCSGGKMVKALAGEDDGKYYLRSELVNEIENNSSDHMVDFYLYSFQIPKSEITKVKNESTRHRKSN